MKKNNKKNHKKNNIEKIPGRMRIIMDSDGTFAINCIGGFPEENAERVLEMLFGIQNITRQ